MSKSGNIIKKLRFILITVFLFYWISCEKPISEPNPNLPPNTTLSNIPVYGDTLFPVIDVTWDGEDFDGYIIGCEYRYITTHLYQGDSIVKPWQFTKDEILHIVFESSDSLNKQRLQIRAVDNKGDVDPTPAELILYTPRTSYPITTIESPLDEETFFVLPQTTDWWQGIRLTYTAYDKDGKVVNYAWSVDDGPWNWTEDTTVFITPENFSQPLSGLHKIVVISKDNTDLLDPYGDTVKVNLIEPSFEKPILIVDETDENQFPRSAKTHDEEVDSFYTKIFGTEDSWDLINKNYLPKNLIGKYKMIVWHADNPLSTKPHFFPQYTEIIQDYLNVGGKLILSGWRILKSFAWDENFPKNFPAGSFVRDYLHINVADETGMFPSDFTGPHGVGEEFSDARVDENKLKSFPYYGKLSQVGIVSERGGFTKIIYSYVGNNIDYAGRTVGLRYYGTSYDLIVLGFPLYFIQEEDAKQMGKEMLINMGFIPPD